MIIYHQNNIAGFKGGHTVYSIYPAQRISVTSTGVAAALISQSRSIGRFVFSRIHSRVN